MKFKTSDTSMSLSDKKPVRLHLTNIAGLGATQLLLSLLPYLEQHADYRLEEIFLPSRGELSNYRQSDPHVSLIHYKRYLSNSISRLLECTIFGFHFDGNTPLLVMGDIPIRCKAKQTVFVQTPLLASEASIGSSLGALKYHIARYLFRRNLAYVSNFIVQTSAMKTALIKTYPNIEGRVHVIAQPPPVWLLTSGLRRSKVNRSIESGLSLFYPAAVYPHKNHRLLSEIQSNKEKHWPVLELLLTVPENLNPNPALSWIKCVDRLQQEGVLKAYADADALLFLSLSESFGFPLVEAMWIGIPIICPDLPYAKTLCGEIAIYFIPDDVSSLHAAIVELDDRLKAGWWPNWTENLKNIPENWAEVADIMLKITTK